MIDFELLNIPPGDFDKFNLELMDAFEHPLIKSILAELRDNLSPKLSYHSVEHTEEVLAEVLLFAIVDGLSATEMELLAIAAAYHDSGFLIRGVDNEILGAERAVREMQADGQYTQKECELVSQMIIDTKLYEAPVGYKQKSSTDLSKYLLDADLGNFGRADFLKKAELQRKEIGQTEDIFYQNTLDLLQNHEFLSGAARVLRQSGKARNIERLQNKLVALHQSGAELTYMGLSLERLGFLTRLPVLLNSSLETKLIIERSLLMLQHKLKAEAATVFLKIAETDEIEFWALQGGSVQLSGERLKKGTGIVGWVIEKNTGIIVQDVHKDPRFFAKVDKVASFTTNNLICVPLLVRGTNTIGALQVLNSTNEGGFTEEDLRFTEHVALHLALALENAQLLETLKQRNLELETLNKRKSEMVSLIAHEFRTPLNILNSGIEILSLNENHDPKLKEILQSGIRRMVKLIDEVRNLAIVSGHKLKLNKENLALQELFDSIKIFFSEPAQHRNLNFVVENCPGVEVCADKNLLLIALKNLISNALRFTPDKGSVLVQAKLKYGQVEISVVDTGIGIKKEEQSLIFQKFYEVGGIYEHSSGTYEFKSAGLGLGLSTTRAILQAHGSSINLESAPNQGSRFYFLI